MNKKTFSLKLIVNKINDSIEFYTSALGFKLINQKGSPAFEAEFDAYSLPVHISEVGSRGDSLFHKDKGLGADFQIYVDDIENLFAKVKKLFAHKITLELDVYENNQRSFSVADFDRYLWTFIEKRQKTKLKSEGR